MNFYWHAETGESIVGSGWAKSVADCYSKAAAAIAVAPDHLFSKPRHSTTIEVTEKKDD